MLGVLSISFAQSTYLLVIDSSGSMGDGIPPDYSETKMAAAKIAAKDFVDSANGEIALMVFDECDSGGNPSSGGIRVLQGFTTSKTSLKNQIDYLEAYADTPIADALTEAKTYLQDTKGYGTIILITDGEETCGGEPVSVAGQIYNQNVGKVHVIGYMIGGTAETTAEQIAVAGGGKYYSVDNSQELEQALQNIRDEEEVTCCPGIALLGLLPVAVFLSRRQ